MVKIKTYDITDNVLYDYGLEIDFTDDIINLGYDIEERTITLRGRQYTVKYAVLRDKNGNVIAEYPIITKEIDFYITGYYKCKSGKEKGIIKEMKIRVPLEITFADIPELQDTIKDVLQEAGERVMKNWLFNNNIMFEPDWIEVEYELPNPKYEVGI